MATSEKRNSIARVVIVDDHEIMRQGLTNLINQEPDLEVCGEAEDARGAMQVIDAERPDVAIVDISLKKSSGIALIKDVKIRYPRVAILVLSMHDESIYAERVLRAGARGYVTKAEASARVVEGLRHVLQGEVYVSNRMASKMLNRIVSGPDAGAFPMDMLTDRELEVFELIGEGLRTREVADRLHLSVKTVENHRENIKRKLNLDNATQLITHAVKWVQIERNV